MSSTEKSNPSSKKKFVWLYIIIAVVHITFAYFYYQYEESVLIKQKQDELESIAKLKINQISDWYKDEKKEAEILSHNTILIKEIQQALITGDNSTLEELTEILTNFKIEHNYADLVITTTKAEIITSTNPSLNKLKSNLSERIIETADKNKLTELDFFRSTSFGDKILLGFISPVPNEEDKLQATITFLIDPEDNIYPLTEFWPLSSRTSETFIFRVDGDSILYLNELRHRKNTALEFVLPKSLSELPAAKAADGYTGIYRGRDYRNVKVAAYLSEIPGTNWYLVSKVDEEELFVEFFPKMVMVSLIVLLLMIITGIGLYLVYSNRQHSLTKSLYTKEKELWRQQEKFKVTVDSLGQGVITLDVDGKVQYMNKIAEELTGWDLRSVRGRDLHEVYPVKNEQTGLRENNILEKIFKYGVVKELANHTILITKNGNEIPVMDTGAPVYDTNGAIIGVSIVFQNETERREHEKRIKDSEERLRSTLDDMIEGCQIIGYDYKYLFLNKAALESSRKTSDELLGKTMMECYPGIENTEMFREIKTCMETRKPTNFENEFTYPDGQKRIFNLRFEPVPEGLFILSEDITDLKSAQDFIMKFKMGIELSGDAVFITDKDGIINYVNPTFEKVFGYSKEEAVGKTPRILKSGTLTREYYDNFWNELLSNKPVNHEIINKTKDGRLIYIEASINPINNETGKIIGYLAIERDVTERKLAEEKRKQLTAILDATPDFVAIADTDGKPIFTNTAGRKMLGLDTGYDERKITIADSHPEWARNIVDEGLQTAAIEGIWIGETALLSRDGHETPISQIIIAHKSEDGEVKYFSTIGRDITERKQYEKELIEKTTLLESFFDNTLTLIALLDKDFYFIRVNQAYANADERDVDFFIGKNHFDLYPSDAKEIFEEVVRTKKAFQTMERPFTYEKNPERGITYWDWSLVPLLNGHGEVESLIFTLLDVTERVKAKEELIKNEKFLSTLFNSVNDAIFTVSMHDRKIQSINKAVIDLFGCDPDEIIGKRTQVLFPSEEAYLEYGRMLSDAKNEKKPFVRAELKLLGKDRTEIFCDVQTTFLSDKGASDLVISVLRDVTEKRKMISELVAAKEKAEEMNKVKTIFFANMSHELRTPFVGIIGYAELLFDELEDPEQKEMANGILSTSNRMMDTLTKILNLSKLEVHDEEIIYKQVDINNLINTAYKNFLPAAKKKNLLFEKTIDENLSYLTTDEDVLLDILSNMLSNAVNYTNEGEISLTAKKELIERKEFCCIKVKDTGIGIPEDKKDIVWLEFRQVSEGKTRNYQGTGLGLTISKKNAELLGGQISFKSEEGKGTTFTLLLPLKG
ncbi:MAG: PAS domain S-box protein [Melioribacteraceae bacterium]|nr:PAS domain S-box protein [Melioribacteraceae bacterium]MCF8356863.1 PAS domain S-box protein [Melioribacteraceae bacterium]MCF8394880.1 PAS domain S-box protein [Melioribacteraceae bacterium]MCF8420413.1 PAS domain S-box protein [Melioribacteraceae bacterium]